MSLSLRKISFTKTGLALLGCLVLHVGHSQTFLNQLQSKGDFDKLAGLPLSSKYGQVSAVKLVYKLGTDKLYFINSTDFEYHYDFCQYQLNNFGLLEEFNSINYSADSNRQFLLANINLFRSTGTYVLEIAPTDLMHIEYIRFLYKLVKKNTFIAELKFLINSNRLQKSKKKLLDLMPLIEPGEVYQNLKYQSISEHKSCGTLKFINDINAEYEHIKSNEIIVLKETPLALPNVRGILCTAFQTPLSHISLLGRNRKIPIAAYKKAFEDSVLLKLNGQKICLNVQSDTFLIQNWKRSLDKPVRQKKVKLRYNLEIDTLVNLDLVDRKASHYIGNKANNFAKLKRLSKVGHFKVPELSFAIPFYFYAEHAGRANLQVWLDSLLKPEATLSATRIAFLLSKMRHAILNTPVNPRLLQNIQNHLKDNGTYTRFRFRSSTNAEDAPGFSGAGLYSSKTGVLNSKKKSFEKAIQEVWASLWLVQAYQERNIYHINQEQVYMGILVHRSFPKEHVNGVAITRNLYRPLEDGYTINAQKGNASVVNPDSGVICDQFICYSSSAHPFYNNAIEIIAQSSLGNGTLLMTKEEIQQLADELLLVTNRIGRGESFFMPSGPYGNALDVEFKIDGPNRELYFKQVRPY